MRILPAVCLGLVVGCAVPAAPPQTAYRLHMRVETTSDWTVIRLPDALVPIDSRVVSDAGKGPVRVRGTEIVRPDMDLSECVVEFDLLQLRGFGDDMTLTIEKGDLGGTVVVLAIPGVEGSERRIENQGTVPDNPRNPREATVTIANKLYENAETAELGEPREPFVLAFYYPWYGSENGPQARRLHWGDENDHYASTNFPELGLYDSADPETIDQHITWARDAGIDAFVCSWWGETGGNVYVDVACRAVKQVCEAEEFPFTLYIERNESVEQAVRDLRYVWNTYAQSDAFLRLDGKPVLFVYGRVMGQLGLDGWKETFEKLRAEGIEYAAIADGFDAGYLDVFAGYHTYNPCTIELPDLAKTYEQASIAAHTRGKLFVATVLPGYDDTIIRTPGFKRDRQGGAFYPESWRVATESHPDWIIITTWNEWHEGSEIEPSKEYGHQYLDLTRRLVSEWKQAD